MSCDLCQENKAALALAGGPAFCILCLGAMLRQLDEEGSLHRILDIIRARSERGTRYGEGIRAVKWWQLTLPRSRSVGSFLTRSTCTWR